jgi:hypothetical protein
MNLWLRRAPSLGSLEVWSTGSSQNPDGSGRVREYKLCPGTALFADDHPRAPAKFQKIGAVYDLSTVFPRI